MRSERRAGLHAGKPGPGDKALQAGPVGSIADEDQYGLWKPALHVLEGLHHEIEILLASEASHIKDDGRLRAGAPALAQVHGSMLRPEQAGIDAAGKEAQVLESIAGQPCDQVIGGNEGAEGAVVEAAEPLQNQRLQKPESIMLSIAVEIRVEAGDDGNVKLPGNAQGAPAERSLRGDVDQIGPGLLP